VEALHERIVVYDQAISATCELCAELDCLLSFAAAARTYAFIRPRMSEENVIQIVQGRFAITPFYCTKMLNHLADIRCKS
jgi:DNA mismatch repair protein MSH5